MEAGVASVMSVQDKLICVHLVMPHCTFGMQLFVRFVLIESKASCTNLSSSVLFIHHSQIVCFSRY